MSSELKREKKMAKYSNGLEDNLDLTDASKKVLEKRYLSKNDEGVVIETGDDMFKRVAYDIAQADLKYDKNADITKTSGKFYYRMAKFEFLPNSPTLMNAGKVLQQLAACFVLPIPDDLKGIYKTLGQTAIVHQSGGGTGFSFNRLRPNGSIISSTKGRSPGSLSFLDVFNASTGQITQGGTRRGANMAMLNHDHGDVMDFIYAKEKEGMLKNFNMSIAVSDEFMELVKNNGFYMLKGKDGKPYTFDELNNRRTPMELREGDFKPVMELKLNNVINNRNGKTIGKLESDIVYLNARAVFESICDCAWKNGEPGMVFLDRINQYNPTPEIGKIESTNPCGEQPLLPYEACNLGGINLSKFVEKKQVNWKGLESVVNDAVHFLDNVIDMNRYPIKEIEEMCLANRKIGMGVMGWADMLIELEIPYNSEEAIGKAKEVMSFIKEKAVEQTKYLAKIRGPFPNFGKSIYKNEEPRRNATLTTIAPTGTTGVIAGASQGIEPLVALAYLRNVKDTIGSDLIEVNQIFKRYAHEQGFWSNDLIKVIEENGEKVGVKVNYDKIPDNLRKLFVTAYDIALEWHIGMQAAFQEFTDNAVSKTTNLVNSATKEDIKNVFMSAYDKKCKGITIYRDGSRDKQILTTKKKDGIEGKVEIPLKRPEVLSGSTKRMRVGCGKLYITKNVQEEKFREVFTSCDFHNGCQDAYNNALNKMISLAAQHNISPEEIGKTLMGVKCDKYALDKYRNVSCPDAIGKVIQGWIPKVERDKLNETKEDANNKNNGDDKNENAVIFGQCPKCHIYALEHVEGCDICHDCGYSKCD